MLTQLVQREQRAGVRVVLSNVVDAVRAELDRYGITALIGADGIFDTSGEVLAAYGERRLAQTAVPFCHCAQDSSQSP